VSAAPRGQRIAEWLIRAACRRLPADVRADRCREWTAELPAILGDEGIRLPLLRALRALAFCAGISKTARQLSRSWRASSRRARGAQWRSGGLPGRPSDLAVRVVRGLVIWLIIVAGAITLLVTQLRPQDPHTWPLLIVVVLGIGFDAFCLVDIARAADVRYLRKWAWVVICLAQCPLGGILYLSIGRVGRARPVPPSDTRP
jgi:Phospholipase_D-nuclease N-terminal